MIYTEKQVKELQEQYMKQLRNLKKENEIKEKENKILKQQNKQKDEIIHDLDRYNYRGQCESLRLENEELKKKARRIQREIRACENQLRKR